VQDGKVEKDATIMLNITGAGEQAFKREHATYSLEPAKVFPLNVTAEEVVEFVEGLFAQE
jgi:cysteate synthase